MYDAEQSECPIKPMPKTDQDHIHKKTQYEAQAAEVSRRHSQWRKDIVGHPQRQGDMPTPPILTGTRCEKRRIEIFRRADAGRNPSPNCNARRPSEIGIHLRRRPVKAQSHRSARMTAEVTINVIHDPAKIVGDHEFLEETEQYSQ